MAKKEPPDRVQTIREWFARHRSDYCVHDQSPPLVWSEYFGFLLRLVEQYQRDAASRGALPNTPNKAGANPEGGSFLNAPSTDEMTVAEVAAFLRGLADVCEGKTSRLNSMESPPSVDAVDPQVPK
jgi:hypothetical protein